MKTTITHIERRRVEYDDSERDGFLRVYPSAHGWTVKSEGPVNFAADKGALQFCVVEREVSAVPAAAPAAPDALSRSPQPASVRMLAESDMAALQRISETFEDGQGWDITKDQMTRLADLGAVRWHGASRYSITAFGRMALNEDFSRWPLETVEECNARLAAANNLTVKD